MPKNSKTVSMDGPPCPRCGLPTEVREHKHITAKELARPFYYTRWYTCRNRRCRTTLIMSAEHRQWPARQHVESTPAAHRDIALEVLDEMAGGRPPWE
jgi:hypothetical protein